MFDIPARLIACTPLLYESVAHLVQFEAPGFCYLHDQPRIPDRPYGGMPPCLHSLGPCNVTMAGAHREGKYWATTTLAGLYPHYAYINDVDNNNAVLNTLMDMGLANSQGEPQFTVDNAVLAVSSWDHNYQHFLIETFPRIYAITQVAELAHLPIIVQDEKFIRQIVAIAFPNRQFIFFDKTRHGVITGRTFFLSAITRNFHEQPEGLLNALRHLRHMMLNYINQEVSPTQKYRQIFLCRLQQAGNQGNARAMLNQTEVENRMTDIGWEVDTFDGKLIKDNAVTLADVRSIMTPIGANLMNMIFASNPIDLVIVGHPNFLQAKWFFSLLTGVGVTLTSRHLFEDVTLADTTQTNENTSYYVDAQSLRDLCRTILLPGAAPLMSFM